MPKKKKGRRAPIKEEESVVSDASSVTASSIQESATLSTSDTESTVTETKSTPKIRFRSGPLRDKSGTTPKLSARETSGASLAGIGRQREHEVASPRSARREVKAESSPTRSSSTSSEASIDSAKRQPDSDVEEPEEQEPVGQEELLTRISSAIPDLHMLLDKYKATHGQLSHRDQLRRKHEAQSAELVRSKESIISALMAQLEDAAKNRADEVSKARSRIASLEMSHLQLRDHIHAAESRAKTLDKHLRRSLKINEDLAIEKTMIIRRARDEKDQAIKKMEKELTAKHDQRVEAMRKELLAQIAEVKNQHESEIKEHTEKLETELSSTNDDLETKLEKAEGDFNGELELKTRYAIEYTLKEEELTKKHEEEMDQLKLEHKNYCNDQIRGFLSLQENLNKALTEENMVLKALVQEYKAGEPVENAE
jgi:hypothetical protein